MVTVRLVGLLFSVLLLAYVVYKRQTGKYRRLDLLIGIVVAFGVAVLSSVPSAANVLTDLFGVQNRLFAVLILANFVLFGLFLYVLNKANYAQRQVGDLVRAMARTEHRKKFAFAKNGPTIFIVIPAYNEEYAIGGVLRQIPKQMLGYEIHPIVVVDGSSDDTEKVVLHENYMVACHVMNRGQGDALRTGFEIALQEQADIVMTMDADGQHEVKDIPNLVQPIIDDQADYVMGSRFLGNYEDSGGWRHTGIVFFTHLINFLGHVNITDCTNGFRAIRGSDLAKLRLTEDRFNAPELIMEAARRGLRLQEVPVTIAGRTAGESKKPPYLGYPLGFLRTIVQVWLR